MTQNRSLVGEVIMSTRIQFQVKILLASIILTTVSSVTIAQEIYSNGSDSDLLNPNFGLDVLEEQSRFKRDPAINNQGVPGINSPAPGSVEG